MSQFQKENQSDREVVVTQAMIEAGVYELKQRQMGERPASHPRSQRPQSRPQSCGAITNRLSHQIVCQC